MLPDNSVLDSSETPKKRRRRSSDSPGGTGPIKMQTEQVVRVPGLPGDLQQQITKFDSSEFDVSLLKSFIGYVLAVKFDRASKTISGCFDLVF